MSLEEKKDSLSEEDKNLKNPIHQNNLPKKDAGNCYFGGCHIITCLSGFLLVVGMILLFVKNGDPAVQSKLNLAGFIVLSVGIFLFVAPRLYHFLCTKNDIENKEEKDIRALHL